MSSISWGCGNQCGPFTWDHGRAHVACAAVPWTLLTVVGVGAGSLFPWRVKNARVRLNTYAVGLVSNSYPECYAVMGSSAFQCIIFLLRSSTRRVDPIYHALEMIVTLVIGLDVVAHWSYIVTHGPQSVLRVAFNGTLVVDSFVITAVFALATEDSAGRKTWFSAAYLAAFRLLRMVDSLRKSGEYSSTSSWRRQIIYHLMSVMLFCFAMGSLVMTFEHLETPRGTEGKIINGQPTWELSGSLLFVFGTMTTLGNGTVFPTSVLGRLAAVFLVLWSLYLLSTLILPTAANMLLGNTASLEGYKPRKGHAGGHVVVVGSPSARMLSDFLCEVYHLDHFDSISDFDARAPDVVVLLPNANTLTSLRRVLNHRSSFLFRSRVIVLKGEPFNRVDLDRVCLDKARRGMVLPNLIAADVGSDDSMNIMRALAMAGAVKQVQILCLLHCNESRPPSAVNGENISWVSVDAYKLSLMAKACLTRGAMAFVSNLCRTTGEVDTRFMKAWKRDYYHSIGCELYEVRLSSAFDGMTFSDVALDVLTKSEDGEVYLIGIIEFRRTSNFELQPVVLIHPGIDYKLNTIDGKTLGVFLAPDFGAITQPEDEIELEKSIPGCPGSPGSPASLRETAFAAVEPENKRRKRKAEPVVKQQQTIINPKRKSWQQMLEEAEELKKRSVAEREKAFAAKKYEEAMATIKHRLIVQGLNVEVIDHVSRALDAEAKSLSQPSSRPRANLGKEEPTPPKVGDKTLGKGSMPFYDAAESLATLEHTQALLERMDFDAKRASAPPNKALAGHLVLCVVSDTTGTCDHLVSLQDGIGPAIGIEHFMRPLRDKRLKGIKGQAFHPPVVVLAESLPADWYTVTNCERLYYVKGSPLCVADLDRAGFRKARTIAVARAHLGGHRNASRVADARVLLLTALVEDNLHQDANTPVICDLSFDGSCAFLPRSTVPIEPPDSWPSPGAPKLVGSLWRLLGLTEDDSEQKQPEEDYESLASLDYAQHHRFMTGQIFLASSMTALMANTLYNPSLVLLVNSLMQAPLLMLPLPSAWERKSYADLAMWLLKARNLLALGLFRSAAAAEAGCFGAPVDETMPTHYYMFTAPPAYKTLTVRTDRILCLAPAGDPTAASEDL